MKNGNKNSEIKLGGIVGNLCHSLTILFCALRACGVITWKWYWVMSPIFALEIFGIIALIVAGAVATNIAKGEKL